MIQPTTTRELSALVALNLERGVTNLNFIDTSAITDMSHLFDSSQGSSRLIDISKWNTSRVTSFRGMFRYADFTGDISQWDTSQALDMSCMFYGSYFNGDISKWDTSNVENTTQMFAYSTFDGDISAWDVSHIKQAHMMFYHSHFSGDLSAWSLPNCGKDELEDFLAKNPYFQGVLPHLSTEQLEWAFGTLDERLAHQSRLDAMLLRQESHIGAKISNRRTL
jgi:surface protein